MNTESLRIPRFLDEPELFPIWTKFESLSVLVPTMGGYFMLKGMGLLMGLAVGITVLKLLKNFTRKHGRYWLIRLCYWYLPRRFLIYNLYQSLPESHIREYIG